MRLQDSLKSLAGETADALAKLTNPPEEGEAARASGDEGRLWASGAETDRETSGGEQVEAGRKRARETETGRTNRLLRAILSSARMMRR